jgi:hypothetical protein
MWINKLPEIGGDFIRRAKDIETTRAELLAALGRLNRTEAELFDDIRKTGRWTRKEMAAAEAELSSAVQKMLGR